MENQVQLIIPLTPEDFKALDDQIGINQDEICLTCEGKLKTFPKGPFAAGIFFKCIDCGDEFQKRKIFDFGNEKGSFRLKKIKGVA